MSFASQSMQKLVTVFLSVSENNNHTWHLHKFHPNDDPTINESYKSLSTAGKTGMLGGEVAYLRSHRLSTKDFTFAGVSDAS